VKSREPYKGQRNAGAVEAVTGAAMFRSTRWTGCAETVLKAMGGPEAIPSQLQLQKESIAGKVILGLKADLAPRAVQGLLPSVHLNVLVGEVIRRL
jgi:hypothetical protein